jgi:hypothetical protein
MGGADRNLLATKYLRAGRPGALGLTRPQAEASAIHPAVPFPEFDELVPYELDLPRGHGWL